MHGKSLCTIAMTSMLSALVALAPSGADAQTPVKDHYTVSGGVSGALNWSKLRVDGNNEEYDFANGWAAGGWLNFPMGRHFSLEPEVQYNRRGYKNKDPLSTSLLSDADVSYLSVPVLLKLHIGRGFAIFAGPQIDFRNSVEDDRNVWKDADIIRTSYAATAGVEVFPRSRLSLYGRYSYGFTNLDDTGNPNTANKYYNTNIQAGIKFKFFGRHILADSDGDGIVDAADRCPNEVGLERYQGCPIPDSDSDGINDEADKCPQVAGIAKYEGCPPPDTDRDGINDDEDRCPTQPGTARYQGCPTPDTDGDGINDDNDRCPTQAGTAQYQGCPPPDSDNDGIIDPEDRCPNVPGVREMMGCPRVDSFSASNVTFATGSSRLTAAGRAELDKVVAYLNTHSAVQVRLDGHTDNTGTDRVNDPLSENRAKSAATYIISRGISSSRITTMGHGSNQPVADNSTAAGRQQNRRVEIVVQ